MKSTGIFLWLTAAVLLGVTAHAQDYSITTTNNAIVLTDLSGNSDTLSVSQAAPGFFLFAVSGRTFSVDGGALLTNESGALPYTNTIDSITINAAGGNDTIEVGAFDEHFPNLTINGGTGDDTINFNGAITFATNANVDANLQDDDGNPGIDSIRIADYSPGLSLSGTGALTLKCSQGIVVGSYAYLSTEHGALTLEANQQASPTSGDFMGLWVRGNIYVYGSGILTVKARGGTSAASSQHGIFVDGASSSITGGTTGTTVIEGTSGTATGDFNYGVGVQGYDGEGDGASIATEGSDLSIVGIGGGAGASQENVGVALYFGGDVKTFGSGKITIVGMGGVGTGGNHRGVDLGAFGSGTSVIRSESGDIQVTGVGGEGSGSDAISLRDAGQISSTSGANTLVIADSIHISTNSLINIGTFALSLQPNSTNATIALGSADAPGILGLSAEELDLITAGNIVIGGTNAWPIMVTAPIALTNSPSLELITAATITDSQGAGPDLTVANVTLAGSLAPGASFGIFSVAGNVTLPYESVFTVEIQGTVPGVDQDQLAASGAVNLGINLILNPVAVDPLGLAPGNTLTLLSRSGGSGTFAGLPEGTTITNFLGSGSDAVISYVGGTGNDVVVTLLSPEIGVQQVMGTDLINGTNLVSGGNVVLGGTNVLALTITNSGNSLLIINSITIGGLDTNDFTVGAPDTNSLAPGESTTFAIQFSPLDLGVRSAALQIANNDPDENPFDIELTGMGLGEPVLIACPSNIVVIVPSTTNGAVVSYPAPVATGIPAPVVTTIPESGSLFPLGLTTVTCIATNIETSNSCSFTVTVLAETAATPLANASLCPGDGTIFATTPSGSGPFAFAWFKDASPLLTETNASLVLTNTTSVDTASYSVVVSGAVNSVTNSATLTVWTNTSATALISLEVCPGTPASFSTIASGTGPFSYSWFKDGSPIVDATNALIELTNVVNGSEGVYSVVVQGLCTAVTNSATLTVWTNTAATALTSLEVCPETPVIFSTIASGTGPFAFAWFKDGSPIPGETNDLLALTNVINGSDGVYSVVVQGLCTAVTNSATLTVWTNTSATALTSLEVCPGTPIDFSTIASGTGPFAYSWFKDGSPLLGETNASLAITNTVNADGATYSVVVQGLCSAVTNSALLTVWTNTAATALISLEVCPGTPVQFSTLAEGTGPFAYSWFKDGSPVTDATNALLELTNVINGSEGIYSVVVQGLCTAVTNSATLTVWTNTAATPLTSLEVCPGTPVLFSTIASGTGPFAFSWFKDGSPITDATNALLELTNVINGSEGIYSVVVQGLCTAVTNSATLTVWTNTAATTLTSLSVCPGEPVLFSTVASGTGPFAFAWFKDGSPLPGETNASFALSNALNADAGVYSVVVQGLCTAVTNAATLTVWTNVSFAAVPPVIAPPKQTAILCSPAEGTGPITYQWFRDGQPIVGATNDCLTLTNVSLANEGNYCVVAAGFCTTATNCVEFGIQRDGVPPLVASAEIMCADNSAGINRVMVVYNEEMYAPDATSFGNYSVPGFNVTNITISPDGLVCIVEFDRPFRCGFDFPIQMMSSRDISGEILQATNMNLSTLALPCCNNTYVLGLPTGYSLVANQLDWRFNSLVDKMPVMPEGSMAYLLKSTVVRTNATTEDGYPIDPEFDIYTFSSGAWNDNPVLNPGGGFFIYVPSTTNITIRGSRPAEILPVPFYNSLETVSRQVPDPSQFPAVFGADPIEGMAVFRFVSTNNPLPVFPPTYQRHLFRRGIWEGGDPSANVGEAWLVQAIQPAIITTNPISQFGVPFGSTVTFSAAAGGTPPFRYQWRLNGLNLPGETNATLTLTNVQLTNGGAYSITVDSFFNTAESAPAYLTFPLPMLPMTNNFADRVVITDPFGVGYSSNVGANKEPGEPNHAGRPGGKSMWIDWQAPASGIAIFATTGSGFDTLLAAYRSGTGGLVEVGSDEESGGFLTSQITFNAVAGEVYSIAVDGFGAEEGPIALSWSLEPTSQTLPVVAEAPQSLVAGLGETVVLRVTAIGTGLTYKWFFNNGEIPAPNRQGPDKDPELRLKNVGPQHVGLYFVRIYQDGRFKDSQPVALQINREGVDNRVRRVLTRDKLLDTLTFPAPALATDVFYPDEFTESYEIAAFNASAAASASATVQRSYTGTQILNTFGSVKQPGEPNHCGIPGGASQWYLYEAPEDGIASINTDGSTFDTILAIYTGTGESFAALVPVTCDNNSGTNGRTSAVSFPAKVGTPYFVAVDGVNGATGVVYLNYTLLKPISLTRVSMTPQGHFRIEAQVVPEVNAFLQRTTNFTSWSTISTNVTTNGFLQVTDTNSIISTNLNYRLLQK